LAGGRRRIWFFRLPGVTQSIQLESGTGMCPFLVEHDDASRPNRSPHAGSVEEAASMVMNFLKDQKRHGPAE